VIGFLRGSVIKSIELSLTLSAVGVDQIEGIFC